MTLLELCNMFLAGWANPPDPPTLTAMIVSLSTTTIITRARTCATGTATAWAAPTGRHLSATGAGHFLGVSRVEKRSDWA